MTKPLTHTCMNIGVGYHAVNQHIEFRVRGHGLNHWRLIWDLAPNQYNQRFFHGFTPVPDKKKQMKRAWTFLIKKL